MVRNASAGEEAERVVARANARASSRSIILTPIVRSGREVAVFSKPLLDAFEVDLRDVRGAAEGGLVIGAARDDVGEVLNEARHLAGRRVVGVDADDDRTAGGIRVPCRQ